MGQWGSGATWLPDFLVLSLIWGSSFALIKVAVDAGVPPVWVALARCFFGMLALVGICVVRRVKLPSAPRTWGHAVIVAVLLNMLPFTFLAYGETQVSSIIAGILNATVPLMTLLFIPLFVPHERLTRRRLMGLLLGFGGVLVVLGIWGGLGSATLVGSMACLASTFFIGAGFAYTRRFFTTGRESATALCAAQLTCATAGLSVVAPAIDGVPVWPGWGPAVSLIALGAAGTGIAYVLNLRVISTVGPTMASTVTYVIPLWSIGIGIVLLSEPLSWNAIVGTALVLAGVQLTRPPRRTESTTPRPDPTASAPSGVTGAEAVASHPGPDTERIT
ncbi:drug/metabolite transporter (DMT)-like permease [Micromonospora sp. Llam0]|nr:DMT family transporter [Micromonospora sp. Llam0]ROO50964.1 drug/metabolite transporter (DMT)-like permease [Micromonospora sp. Llam0]